MRGFILVAMLAALLPAAGRGQTSSGHDYLPCVGGTDDQRAAVQAKVSACGIAYGDPDYNPLTYGSGDTAVGVKTLDHYEKVPQQTIDGQNADIESLTKWKAAQLDLSKQKALEASLSSQLSQATQDQQQAQAQLSATGNQLAGYQSNLNSQQAALAADQAALAQAKVQAAADSAQLQTVAAQITQLQTQIAQSTNDTDKQNYQAQLTQAQDQQTAIQKQVAADQSALDSATNQVARDKSGAASTQASIDKTQSSMSALQGQANNAAGQQAALQSQIAGIEASMNNDMSVSSLPPNKKAATQQLIDCGVPVQTCVPFDQALQPKIDNIMSNVDPVQQASDALQQQAAMAGTSNSAQVLQARQAVQAFFQGLPREYSTAPTVEAAAVQVATLKATVDGQLGAAWKFTRDAMAVQTQPSAAAPAQPSDDKMKSGAAGDSDNKPAAFDPTRMTRLSEVGGLKLADTQAPMGAGGPKEPGAWAGLGGAGGASPDFAGGAPGSQREGSAGARAQGMERFFRFQSGEDALRLAREALAAGDYAAAEREAREAVQRDPTNAAAWKVLARALIARKKYAEAIEAATRAIALAPKDASAWALRAYAKDASGDLSGALADITRAAELDSRFGELARFAKSGGRLSSRMIEEFDLAVGGLPGGWLFFEVLAGAGALALLLAFWLRRRRERRAAAQATGSPPAAQPPPAQV